MNFFKKPFSVLIVLLFCFLSSYHFVVAGSHSYIIQNSSGGPEKVSGLMQSDLDYYNPGQQINLNGSMARYGGPYTVTTSTNGSMSAFITGSPQDYLFHNVLIYLNNSTPNSTSGTLTLTAPSIAGNYNITFQASALGSLEVYNMPIVVIGTFPTVVNPVSSSVTTNSAVIGATVSSFGNPPSISARGVCYSLTANPTISGSGSTCVSDSNLVLGSFTKSIVGLSPNTLYHFRGYATNGYGTGYSPDATFTTSSSPTAVTLEYKPTNIKDLVKAGDSNSIGKTHFYVKIENLPVGQSCDLKMNSSSTGITYTGNGSTIEIVDQPFSGLPSGENSFQIVCNSGVTSVIKKVYGQSGTLDATNGTSCQIPAGGNNCSVPLAWTTTSPASTFITKLYKDGVATSFSGNNSNGSVVVNYGASSVYSTKNKVDGEGSSNNETIENELATQTLSAVCVSGTHWDSTLSECVANSTPLPDLIASMTESSYGAFVSQPKTYTANITNIGNENTSTSFYNLFQIGTSSGSSGGGSGVGYKKDTGSFLKNVFKDINKAEADSINYTILKNVSVGPMNGLATGETKQASASISIDSVGTYYVRACADKNSQSNLGVIQELNEGNNCSDWMPVSVTPVPPVPAPDLTAYAPSTTAGIGSTQPLIYTISAGKTLTFYSTILNEGSITTNKSFQNSFQIQSDITQYIANPNPMPALTDGAVATASKSITFSNVGTFKIRACADIPPTNPGVVSESNENNNCSAYTTVNVVNPVYPDLTASSITPTEAEVGVRTTFYSTISNIGQAIAGTGKGFYNLLQWYDPNVSPQNIHNVVSDDTISPLDAGDTAILSRSVIFSEAGQYYARICADLDIVESRNNLVVESDEDNNCGRWTLINVTKQSGATGEIDANDCEIEDGYSSCESKINWNTYNPVVGATSAVTTPVNQTVATGNSDSTTYKIEYTESPRTFYLYHNNELLDQATATARCKNNDWNEKAGICLPEGDENSIVAEDCEIQEGESTCISIINWYVANPGSTTPAVTSDYPSSNSSVGSGSLGDGLYKIKHGTWQFYLYNNGDELGNDPATAYCVSGTIWDDFRNACVINNNPINGGWTDWSCGSCSVDCGGGTQLCTRSCTDPVPANGGDDCVGPSETTQTCNTQACIVEDNCDNGAVNYPDCDLCPDGSVPLPGQECPDTIGGGGVTLTAVPSWVFKGRPSTLTWESWPGAACNINPGNISVGDSGNTSVSPISTTTYTAVCTDGTDSGSAQTTVRVIKPIIFEN